MTRILAILLPSPGRSHFETGNQEVSTIENLTLSELQNLLQTLQLPPETRFTVRFEDAQSVERALKRQKAPAALKKLKGSGNGNLVAALLAKRRQ